MNVKVRRGIEKKIIRQLIEDAIKAGYSITVSDGEETVITQSTEINKIIKVMFSTDEDVLFLHRNNEAGWFGWVRLIYGNDGYDVIADYTVNLEHIMNGANKISEKYQ